MEARHEKWKVFARGHAGRWIGGCGNTLGGCYFLGIGGFGLTSERSLAFGSSSSQLSRIFRPNFL